MKETSNKSTSRPLLDIWFLLVRLAWRNIWRNKKRSLILMTSVVVSVFVAIIFTSLQNGQDEYLVNITVGQYTGHIQIHQKGYWEEKTLDYTMELQSDFFNSITKIKYLKAYTPRLETYALTAFGNSTKVAAIVGINPESEDKMTNLKSKLIKGQYIQSSSKSIMIAEGLAKFLSVGVGDSVVLYGQGWQGVTVAVLVPISGIVKFSIPETNSSMIYFALPYAQELFNCSNRLTSVSLLIEDGKNIDRVKQAVELLVDENYEVMKWSDMMPELVQAINLNDTGTVIVLFILYIIIGFSIFGTVMVMTLERLHEYGVLISVGMERWRMTAVCAIESLFLSLSGTIIGIFISMPIVFYFGLNPIILTGDYAEAMLAYGYEPILPVSMGAEVFWIQGAIIVFIALCSSLYPLMVIKSLKPAEAIRK